MDKNKTASSIKEILREATKDLLSEESLNTIQEAFDHHVEAKATLREQAALTRQDQEYSQKLEQLLEAIDADKTLKLKKVVEAIDTNNTKKLKAVIKRYNRALNEDAKVFKESLVSGISNYLEEYLDESIPQESINEAVNNKRAYAVLSGLRKQLSIGSSLLDESVREAVIDGKHQIEEKNKALESLNKEVKILKEQLDKSQAALLLEKKSQGLPDKKKEYLKRILSNKPAQFIKENFEYTLNLYDKKENEQLDILKEEAFESRVSQDDAPTKIVTETNNSNNNGGSPMAAYMEELQRT